MDLIAPGAGHSAVPPRCPVVTPAELEVARSLDGCLYKSVLLRWAGVALVVLLASAAAASAEPVGFAHGTIDQQWTTTQPGAPTGLTFTGTYHAAGNPQGDPPYM